MNTSFFVATLVMSLLAAAFLLRPLAIRSEIKNRGMARLPLLLGVVAVIFAVALYSYLGRPDMASGTSHASVSNAAGTRQPVAGKTETVPSVASLVSGLEERLANEPDDAKGWLLLAKTYQHLGRNDDAGTAYDKAVALGQSDAKFAESLRNPAATNAAARDGVQIRGRVSLSDDARALVASEDSVFIFAKAVDGPPMPLAVLRRPVSDLPFEFVLSDAQAMVQGNALSGAEMVIVTAKISAPKDALRSVANLEVHSEAIATKNAPHLELKIGSAQ